MWETLLRTAASFPWEQVLMPKGKPGEKAPTEASDQKHLERRAQELARRVQAGHMSREAAVEQLRHDLAQPQASSSASSVTTAETVAELKQDLAKELYRLELDLLRGGRIAGKPCDCLRKHGTLGVRAVAEELMPMDPSPTYGQIVSWMQAREQEFDPQVVSQHTPEHYRALASKVREFRKQVTA